MPKRKASSWPKEVLEDPDISKLDEHGRFIHCKLCQIRYAMHGGKKPKPVAMNSCFRTRAWDVHKERTSCHRMRHLFHPTLLTEESQKIAESEGCRTNRVRIDTLKCFNSRIEQTQCTESLNDDVPEMQTLMTVQCEGKKSLDDSVKGACPASTIVDSEKSREYWGTLRSLYRHGEKSLESTEEQSGASPDSSHVLITPDRTKTSEDSGGSEASLKMEAMGDQALINAVDRLSGIVSKYYVDQVEEDNSSELQALTAMSSNFSEIRDKQQSYFIRLVQTEERRARVMEQMLRYKIRKEERKLRDASYLIELQKTNAMDRNCIVHRQTS